MSESDFAETFCSNLKTYNLKRVIARKKKNKRLILVYTVNYFISPVSHWRHLHRIVCLNIDIASFYGHSRVHKLIPFLAPFRAKIFLWIFSSLRVSSFQKCMNQLPESDQYGTKRGQHQNEF